MYCPFYTFHLIAGTVFYFAVESEDELLLWMDCITLATFKQDFSETGQESEGGVFVSLCQCLFLTTVLLVVNVF
jgi:sulfur transfer complex TusBCD TusB component (DsrH family)